MKKAYIALAFVAVAGVAAVLFFTDILTPRDARTPEGTDADLSAYEHVAGGFSFRYPETYVVVETAPEEGSADHSVSVIDRDEWEAFQNATEPREGPPSITVAAFENPENLPFQVWLRENPHSNFTLGSEEFASMVLQDGVGVRYQWSGLYEGESVALFADGTVYLISVTYFSSDDQIVGDFETILDTFELTNRAERVSLALDEEGGAYNVVVTPREVLEDSRCPVDAQCIQAGTVRLRATLASGLGVAEQEFALGQPVTTEAEEIILVEVTPATAAGETIDQSAYRFHFRISKR